MAHRGRDTAYGDLAERRQRLDSKYSQEVEKLQVPFLEKLSGEKKTGDFQDWLRSGVVLCKAINTIKPGSCKNIHTGSMAFKQMENIAQFLSALPSVGIRTEDAFQTADLFEGVNMYAVQVCIETLRRVSDAKDAGKPVTAIPSKVALPAGSTKFGAAPTSSAVAAKSAQPKYTAEKSDNSAYGDLAERMERLNSKYDVGLEKVLRGWISSKTGQQIDGDFQEALKDGSVLCALANALKPGSIPKVNKSSLAFKQMENINHFIEFARNFGVRTDDLFQTVDLFEGTNMVQVLQTLDNLKRLA